MLLYLTTTFSFSQVHHQIDQNVKCIIIMRIPFPQNLGAHFSFRGVPGRLDALLAKSLYSGEYDACDVTLSVYPHRASLKNMPGHGGNLTYDLWNTSPNALPTELRGQVGSSM